jgi:flavin reductase (DIM6/NTAB) family NADH-FMN oxidoreductase RutF/DNA-binding GntR family transcriptional regulator
VADQPQVASALPTLDPKVFREVIGHFASGVTVITAAKQGELFGTTASAVTSLSMEPPMLVVCLNRTSTTGQAIAQTGRLAVNILTHDQGDLATHFSSKAPDKFEGVAVAHGDFGQPVLPEALAHLECEVTETTLGGTHRVFLAEVRTATAGAGSPLAYYRGRFGRFLDFPDSSAYDELRTLVLKRTFVLGEELDVDALAQRFGIERSSIVSALTRLTQEGLTVRVGPLSYQVRPVDEPLIVRALHARCALTVGVIQTVIDELSEERIEVVRRAAKAAAPAPEDGDDASHPKADGRSVKRFHEAVIGLADNSLLLETYQRLSLPQILAQAVGEVDWSGHHRRLAPQRMELVSALERRDAAAATEITIRYTHDSLEACRQAIRSAGGGV